MKRKKLILIPFFVAFLLLFVFVKPGWAVPGATVKTALGDIVADPSGLTGWVVKNSIKIAGGCSFLLMLYGGFLFLTSAGDPQKLQEATDVIFSAIAGLLLIIFSVFLLELIGYRILSIF